MTEVGLTSTVSVWLGPAYIGPGAGFAFLGSFLIFFIALALAFFSLLAWPVRAVRMALARRRREGKPRARRVVIVGLDGLDPRDVRRLMARGELPHFAALAKRGFFTELRTTCPPISPVAWSSFMTGANPGKHNIFDFLNRDLRTNMPELSSSRIDFTRRGKPVLRGLRRSKPFWHILGDYGVPATVLRVPITFPPERFRGRCLAAMCVPDLRGTQGMFTVFEEAADSAGAAAATGGRRIHVTFTDERIRTALPGPTVGERELSAPLTIRLRGDGAALSIGAERVALTRGQYSPWVRVAFRTGRRRAYGICRFLLVSAQPAFRLYVTPINIDPARPSLPISHPLFYAVYLARLHGPFATLGVAEDTWALNERVIDHEAYLAQVADIHDERERMFFDALARSRSGLLACVFDTPDRVQHVFRREPGDDGDLEPRHRGAVDAMCRRMDALLGRILARIDDRTALFVMSDHGFGDFRRGLNLNAWLRDEGYLALNDAPADAEYFANVDWSRTRAYAFGLAGIYLNLRGREQRGIVSPGAEAAALKAELSAKLAALRDGPAAEPPVRRVYDAAQAYTGPYKDNGPDLIVGYANGYRASWHGAVGRTDGAVFEDNAKAWRADHCIDPALVPGILLGNQPLDTAERIPHIMDIAPTVLSIFGIAEPGYMDGKPLPLGDAANARGNHE